MGTHHSNGGAKMTEGWTKLSDGQPTVGAHCNWLIPYNAEQVKGEGTFYSQSRLINNVAQNVIGFQTPNGLMVSPPELTYWMEVLE